MTKRPVAGVVVFRHQGSLEAVLHFYRHGLGELANARMLIGHFHRTQFGKTVSKHQRGAPLQLTRASCG